MKRRIAFMLLVGGGVLAGGFVVWGVKADDDATNRTGNVRIAQDTVEGTPQRLGSFRSRSDPKIHQLRSEYIKLAESHANMINDQEGLEKAIRRLRQEIKAREVNQRMETAVKLLLEVHQSQPDTEAGIAARRALDAINLDDSLEQLEEYRRFRFGPRPIDEEDKDE